MGCSLSSRVRIGRSSAQADPDAAAGDYRGTRQQENAMEDKPLWASDNEVELVVSLAIRSHSAAIALLAEHHRRAHAQRVRAEFRKLREKYGLVRSSPS
jgi:hypothetical protein